MIDGLPFLKMGGSFHGELLVITRWYIPIPLLPFLAPLSPHQRLRFRPGAALRLSSAAPSVAAKEDAGATRTVVGNVGMDPKTMAGRG